MALLSYQHYITLKVTHGVAKWKNNGWNPHIHIYWLEFTDCILHFIQHKVTELEFLLQNQSCILHEVSRSNWYISCSVTRVTATKIWSILPPKSGIYYHVLGLFFEGQKRESQFYLLSTSHTSATVPQFWQRRK